MTKVTGENVPSYLFYLMFAWFGLMLLLMIILLSLLLFKIFYYRIKTIHTFYRATIICTMVSCVICTGLDFVRVIFVWKNHANMNESYPEFKGIYIIYIYMYKNVCCNACVVLY